MGRVVPTKPGSCINLPEYKYEALLLYAFMREHGHVIL